MKEYEERRDFVVDVRMMVH